MSVQGSASSFEGVQGAVALQVDWIAFTYPDGLLVADLCALYSEDWTDTEVGGLGYKAGKVAGNMRCFHDGAAGMGTHFEISGKGCREMEGAVWFMDWAGVVSGVEDRGGKITRLDVCIDEKIRKVAGVPESEPLLDPVRISAAIDGGLVVSRFKHAVQMRKRSLKDGKQTGWTEYFGSAASDVIIRIYDKAAEQTCSPDWSWVRVEIQFRRERAAAAAGLILAGRIGDIAGVVRGYLQFKDQPAGTDSNKRRWPVSTWWQSFLDGASRCQLTVDPKRRSAAVSRAWVARSVAPTIAMLMQMDEGDLSWLVKEAKEAVQAGRLKPWQLDLIKASKQEAH